MRQRGRQAASFDQEASRQRNTVERFINRKKPCRGIAVRSDEKATINLARRHIADVFLWSADDPNEITYINLILTKHHTLNRPERIAVWRDSLGNV